MNSFIQNRESKHSLININSIIHSRSKNCSIVCCNDCINHIKFTGFSLVIPNPLCLRNKINIIPISTFNYRYIFNGISRLAIFFNNNIPKCFTSIYIPPIKLFSNLWLMLRFLREFNINKRFYSIIPILELVVNHLIIANAGIIGLCFTDNLCVIFNRDRTITYICRKLILKQADFIIRILSVIPESPVNTIFRPLTSSCRHCEGLTVCLLNYYGSHQFLKICHLVFDHSTCKVHACITISQNIMNGILHCSGTMIYGYAFLFYILVHRISIKDTCA